VRVLFSSTAGAGHFAPLVPVARACVEAGHDVLVATPPSFGGPVVDAGFEHCPFGAPSEEALAAVFRRLPTMTFDEANATVIREVFGTLDAGAALPRLREVCETWRPDLVVRDPAELASPVAAELAGVPHARVAASLASVEDMSIRLAAEPVDVLRRSVGLAPDADGELLRRSPYLTMFPASFEDPDGAAQPDTRRFADPAWDPAPEERDGPRLGPEGDGPLVYVTFGSVAGGLELAGAAYRAALDAVADLDVRVLLTIGHGADAASLGPVPANVRVERWVPQAAVLASAAAVVCHGGSATTLGTLAAGLPMVVVPLFADQPFNAARVEAVGAGLVVAPPEPGELAAAVSRVVTDPPFGVAARAVAAEMRSHPPAGDAVAALCAAAQR
jgi:UDP:flavonoid glycosyltransferase YjiC (YdhE family)